MRYLEALRLRTAYIDIRGLQVGTGKAHRFPIEELYIPLSTAGVAEQEPKPGRVGRDKPSNDLGPSARDPVAPAGDPETELPGGGGRGPGIGEEHLPAPGRACPR